MVKKEESGKIVLFEGNEIRRTKLDDEWYYVVEDVIFVLTESRNPKEYIKKLKARDNELNKGWGQFVTPLPIKTKGGKQNVNCANTEGVFRLIP